MATKRMNIAQENTIAACKKTKNKYVQEKRMYCEPVSYSFLTTLKGFALVHLQLEYY
jgi:hypothetical protein